MRLTNMRTSKLKSFVSSIERFKKDFGQYPRYAFLDSSLKKELLQEICSIPTSDKATMRTIKRTQLVERESIKYTIRFGMSERDF